MADLTQFYKSVLIRILELMEYGMTGVIINRWEKVKTFFINDAGTLGYPCGERKRIGI